MTSWRYMLYALVKVVVATYVEYFKKKSTTYFIQSQKDVDKTTPKDHEYFLIAGRSLIRLIYVYKTFMTDSRILNN